MTSAATHAVLPKLATRAAAAFRSTPACARTTAASAPRPASGCPSAPTCRAPTGCWQSVASPTPASTSARANQTAPRWLRPCCRRADRVHDRLAGGRAGLGEGTAIPPTPPTSSTTGSRPTGSAGRSRGALRPRGCPGARGRPRARVPGGGALTSGRARREAGRPWALRVRDRHRAARALVGGGAELARRGPRRRRGGGVHLLTLSEALGEHEPEPRHASESSWGRGKGLETWDSPAVVDLAWAARRLELRMLGAMRGEELIPDSPGCRERGPRAAGRAVKRLGIHGPLGPGGDYSKSPATPRPCWRPLTPHSAGAMAAEPGPGPQPRTAAGALTCDDSAVASSRVLILLLGVPAADRGRAGAPRAQALRRAGGPRDRGPRAHPRRRGAPPEEARTGSTCTACASRPGPRT